VKTQQGVPSQPANLRAVENRATSIKLAWEQPAHSGENIISYELYWNDSFANEVAFCPGGESSFARASKIGSTAYVTYLGVYLFILHLKQGCQMEYFQTKNPNVGKFWRVLQ
jgi:hypothetical protein